MLLRLADAIEEHAAELVAMESKNVGKPRPVAEPEIPFAADTGDLRRAAGQGCADSWTGPAPRERRC